ncbi:MAG: FG-GAP repeat protein [Spirochaetaceae bacterium]|jgi:hypothetical protein|nr:FG-GAP repeat protein [Spirochaetaceae bacterium]
MGRLKIKIVIIFIFVLTILNCDFDLQNYIVDDLFGPPYRDQVAKLLPTNGSVTEDFGFSVDIDGNYAIVGAPSADSNLGAAYIFERQADGTWNSGQRITALVRTINDGFGNSVAISGDWAVVGASNSDADLNGVDTDIPPDGVPDTNIKDGKAFIFQRDSDGNWTESQDLDVSYCGGDIDEYEFFGSSVAIDGSWMVIGARGDDRDVDPGGIIDYGAAYVLKRTGTNWGDAARLNDGVLNSSFGTDVDIYGDIMVVGAPREDTDGNLGVYPVKQGAAYIYRYDVDGWILSGNDNVTASLPTHHALLGYSVSISTNYIVAGAIGEGIAGTVSLFSRSGTDDWNSEAAQQIIPENSKDGDVYGIGLATDGSYILAGAPYSDYYSPLSGSVFLYEIGDDGIVTLKQPIAPENTSGLKGWGISIAIDDGRAIIGQNEDPFNGGDGAAYIFE